MKTNTNLRQNLLSNLMKSAFAASLLSFSLMSCSKEDITPLAAGQDPLRSTSDQSVSDAGALDFTSSNNSSMIAGNGESLITGILVSAPAGTAAYRIDINKDLKVHFNGDHDVAAGNAQFRITRSQYDQVMNILNQATSDNNIQGLTLANHSTVAASQAELRNMQGQVILQERDKRSVSTIDQKHALSHSQIRDIIQILRIESLIGTRTADITHQ